MKSFLNFEAFDKRTRTSYDEKLTYTREVIRKAYEEFGDKLSVSCSFGKDSLVVLALAREVLPDIPVLWANTGVEFPETVKFARKLAEEWNLNLIECKPVKTFWQCVEEYGFPWPRKIRLKNGTKAPGTPRCCYYMKELPMRKAVEELGIEATIDGVRAEESYNRKWAIIRHGVQVFVKKKGYWFIHPIAYWTSSDIWRFIEENSLPVNPLYDKIERIGCITCTAHFGWEKQMATVSPGLYRLIMRKMRELEDSRATYLLEDFDSLF